MVQFFFERQGFGLLKNRGCAEEQIGDSAINCPMSSGGFFQHEVEVSQGAMDAHERGRRWRSGGGVPSVEEELLADNLPPQLDDAPELDVDERA